jgi:3-phosphoshikimate 1-carboxyvinyltransferase
VAADRVARIRRPRAPLIGTVAPKGDKSVSIRRALFSIFTKEQVALDNYGSGEDCLTALLCLRALGKRVEIQDSRIEIEGSADQSCELDCRNSGTTARLLMGLLAGRVGEWTLIGDESLSRRPMQRVAEPLRRMGAMIELTHGKLPAKITGARLHGATHDLEISSAQLKSALLLAGLFAEGETRVREPLSSRDHTERLLGLTQDAQGFWRVNPDCAKSLSASSLSGEIPCDISSAAFWAGAAMLVPGSEIAIRNLLLNPLRAGWITVLKRAGADISYRVEHVVGGEPVGTVIIRHSQLSSLKITADEVPGVIDEIPVLSVIASVAGGTSRFENLAELRVKESDRLAAIADCLSLMNVRTMISGDNLSVEGNSVLQAATIDPRGDHRIALAFACAGLAAEDETTILDPDCASVSYPEFWSELSSLSHQQVL